MDAVAIMANPRKPLTLSQIVYLAVNVQSGRCALCGKPLGEGPFRDEHLVARGLGGSEALSNRGIAHRDCSKAKDFAAPTKASNRGADLTEIARTKRLSQRHREFQAKLLAPDKGKAEPTKRSKWPSRPFDRAKKRPVPR